MSRVISGNLIWQVKQEGHEWDESGPRTQKPRPAFSSLFFDLPWFSPYSHQPSPQLQPPPVMTLVVQIFVFPSNGKKKYFGANKKYWLSSPVM